MASLITLLFSKLFNSNHNATVSKGQGPEDPNRNHSIKRPVEQLVLHWESHCQVALHANTGQQPHAVVATTDSESEDYLMQVTVEVRCSLNYLGRQR